MRVRNISHSYKLQEDWNTYDRDNFKFKVLEEIDDNLKIIIQKCLLYILEDKYIKQYNSINNGYNIEETLELILKGEKPIFEGMEIKKKQIFIMKNIINNIKINNGMYVSIDKTKRIKSTNNKNISLEYLYNNDNIKFIIDHCKNYIFQDEYETMSKVFEKNGFYTKRIYQILRDINILYNSNNVNGNICLINDLSMFRNDKIILRNKNEGISDQFNVPYITRKGFEYLLDKILDYAKNNNINIYTKKFISINFIN